MTKVSEAGHYLILTARTRDSQRRGDGQRNILQIFSPNRPKTNGWWWTQSGMAKLVVLQQKQPSFSILPASLSDFNGARLQTQIQVLPLPMPLLWSHLSV